jgi:hypothetical protein
MSVLTHSHLSRARFRLRRRGGGLERFAPALDYPVDTYPGGPNEAARGNALAEAVGAPTAPPNEGARAED